MRILDRYILSSIAATFLFGVAMFLALLMAMDMLQKLIEMIAEQGIPVGTALTVFAYRIPASLVYAFPMSVLLSILLVFNRMSSDSEMVAIRAAGVSFARIVVPALLFAVVVTGITFWISDAFAPYAGKQALEITQRALKRVRTDQEVTIVHSDKGKRRYLFTAANFDADQRVMSKLDAVFYDNMNEPWVFIHANSANWNLATKSWEFHGATLRVVKPNVQASGLLLVPKDDSTKLSLFAQQIKENPLDISMAKRRPEEMTAFEIQKYIAHLRELGKESNDVNKWQMNYRRRFSVPFTCLIFALIAAPLGLRHHRTSSAMGLGISLLLIFAYYTLFHYLSMLGENDKISADVAAWLPNVLGAIIGTVLIFRANR